MRLKLRLGKDKKGISPVFAAIYLSLLAFLLISTLFVALFTYGSAISDRIKMEEERQQESVTLAGPKALNLTASGSYFEALRVNNTGTIMIRIRALYIGGKFICDPSRFSGDSYINAKEFMWIRLYPYVSIELNQTTLDAFWTVTTERGVRGYETGTNLIFGPPGSEYNPMRFYIGPLMILFDMFHWRSGTGPWQNGWSIPKNTKDVTWRILISNIDNRDIEVTDRSSFTLISNDNAPSAPVPWYIDPLLSSLYYRPGAFYFVYYSWSKPYSEGGASRQSANVFGDGTTCINFLMFLGNFINPNGTRTPYGQTIPFEAVIVTTETMPSSLSLVASPANIPNDGVSTATITATVRDGRGNPVPDAWVDFYTTEGTLSATHGTTNANGEVAVTLRSATTKTTAYVAALCQGVEGTTRVSFTQARAIKVSASPPSVPKGGTSRITIQLKDVSGQNVTQSGVVITVTLTGKGQLEYGTEPPGSTQMVTTDGEGRATLTFKAAKASGSVTITAQASGLTADSVSIQVG